MCTWHVMTCQMASTSSFASVIALLNPRPPKDLAKFFGWPESTPPPALEPGDIRWVDVQEKGVPSVAIDLVADGLQVARMTLAKELGLSTRTVNRRVTSKEKLTPEEADLMLRTSRALVKARELLGEDGGRAWLLKPALRLGGAVPLTLLRTTDGFTAVMNELGRIDYGVIS